LSGFKGVGLAILYTRHFVKSYNPIPIIRGDDAEPVGQCDWILNSGNRYVSASAYVKVEQFR